jgi:hypothetical protein
MEGAVLWIDYTQPGGFEWPPSENWMRWELPGEPGPSGRRVLYGPICEQTREAALAALRRAEPEVREAPRRTGATAESIDEFVAKMEVAPTRYYLAFVYVPGLSNKRPLYIFDTVDKDSVETGY